MRTKRGFRPVLADLQLEERVVLSDGNPGQVSPIVADPFAPRRLVRVTLLQRSTEQINQAFDSFETDYLKAQSIALSTTSGKDALDVYTDQRINLLSQQLTRALIHLPGSLDRPRGEMPVIQQFLARNISGSGDNSLSLRTELKRIITGSGPFTGGIATLYTTSAVQAIEAARATTINGVGYLRGNVFVNGHPAGHHHHRH